MRNWRSSFKLDLWVSQLTFDEFRRGTTRAQRLRTYRVYMSSHLHGTEAIILPLVAVRLGNCYVAAA